MAGALGFEPRPTDPESAVLPLYYAPEQKLIIYNPTIDVKLI